MSRVIERVREQHGDEVAAVVETAARDSWNQEVVPALEKIRGILDELFGSLEIGDVIQAQALRASFKPFDEKLKARKRLLLNYRSKPAAVVVDADTAEDVRETIESIIALLERQAAGGSELPGDAMWERMASLRPQESLYGFTIDSLVIEEDLPRLREKWFRTAPEWDELTKRLRQAVDAIRREPRAGGSLEGPLRDYYRSKFCSSSSQGDDHTGLISGSFMK